MPNFSRLWRFCLAALLLSRTSAAPPVFALQPGVQPLKTIILWNPKTSRSDSLDQCSFERTLESVGFHTQRLDPRDLPSTTLDSNTLLVAPRGAAALLKSTDIAFLLRNVRAGASLVADGKSPLTKALGVRLGAPARTYRVRDHYRPEVRIFWSDRPEVPWIAGAPLPAPRIVWTHRATGHPLGMIMQIGKGRCLYIAPLFDPRSGRGYGRFTTITDAIVKGLGRTPLFVRQGADTYFDPGYRTGEPPDSLAALWRHRGIRAVHAAAWYTYEDPPYDYGALIEACHRNGILVYAWLEWPYIGRGFWYAHPEWRQKTATLKDAHFDFLHLMDIQNPACMGKALGDLDSLLTLEWDGVDVAEFTLTGAGKQGLEGPARPDWFTGFTDYCRAEFKARSGFDPLELFDHRSPHYWKTSPDDLQSFYRYRKEVNSTTQQKLFAVMDRMRRDRGRSWEFILTIVDNSLHPEFDDLIGFDMKSTAALLREFDVTLQVEDPYLEWTMPPERYVAVGEHYRDLLGDRPFLIDVNVVPLMPERWRDFTTGQPAGTEVHQFWRFATRRTDRACFYCESSVYQQDWELMPFAMAAGASAVLDSSGWTLDAPSTVFLRTGRTGSGWLLDGRTWKAYTDSSVIIPAGRHTLRPSGTERNNDILRLVSINGELHTVQAEGNGISVGYRTRPRCALGFSRTPGRTLIDGVAVDLPVYRQNDGGSVVLAPPGAHTLTVFAQ